MCLKIINLLKINHSLNEMLIDIPILLINNKIDIIPLQLYFIKNSVTNCKEPAKGKVLKTKLQEDGKEMHLF